MSRSTTCDVALTASLIVCICVIDFSMTLFPSSAFSEVVTAKLVTEEADSAIR